MAPSLKESELISRNLRAGMAVREAWTWEGRAQIATVRLLIHGS